MPFMMGSEGLRKLGAHARGAAVATALLWGQTACSAGREQAASQELLSVQVAGCAMIDGEGSCTLDAQRTLRVWVPAPWAQTATFRSDAGELEVREQAATPDGVRATLTVPVGVRSVSVKSQVGHTVGAYRLQLRDEKPSPILDEATAMRRDGRAEQAKAHLEAKLPELSGIERARAVGLLARIELGLGRYEDARFDFERALELDRLHGAVSLEMEDACALTFLMITRLYMFEQARALLDETREVAKKTADGRARFPYFEGLLAFETGDLRQALSAFRASRDAAQRLGLSVHERTARDRIAAVLQALGRTGEAIAELRSLGESRDPAASDCERADVLINLGWYYVDQKHATRSELEQATALLSEARALFPARCADPFRQAVTLTNLAYAAEQLGLIDAANDYLSRARTTGQAEESLKLWWLDLEGRLKQAAGAYVEARQAFEQAASLAESLLLPDLRFRALLGLGETFEHMHEPKQAQRAYAQAEAVLDQHALGVPLGEGRAAFLAAHDLSARALIELQLQTGDVQHAFQTARHARLRLLRALEESARVSRLDAEKRARWLRIVAGYGRARAELLGLEKSARDLPLDQLQRAETNRKAREQALLGTLERELSALTPPEAQQPLAPSADLTLLYRPLREGFVGFAERKGAVVAHVFEAQPDAADPGEETSRWLSPFTQALEKTDRVRVMAEGALAALDFHALPFQGRPLLSQAAVTYPLDLPTLPMRPASAPQALVVSDPNHDLPLAREEASFVIDRLRALTVPTRILEGGAATTEAVAAAIPGADHIHFAGHAWFAGKDGFESELQLARGERMSVGDVLASSITARSVVLSGCQAAQARGDTHAGLGMASAFVLAGSSTVVAPTRSIDDADTARLMQLLYERAPHLTEADWAQSLRSAQLALREERPQADWSAFRTLTR